MQSLNLKGKKILKDCEILLRCLTTYHSLLALVQVGAAVRRGIRRGRDVLHQEVPRLSRDGSQQTRPPGHFAVQYIFSQTSSGTYCHHSQRPGHCGRGEILRVCQEKCSHFKLQVDTGGQHVTGETHHQSVQGDSHQQSRGRRHGQVHESEVREDVLVLAVPVRPS